MSIQTYSDLQNQVGNWLSRSSDTNITSNVTDFIALGEDLINYGHEDESNPSISMPALRVRQMETSTTLTTVASSSTIALPADYLELRSISLNTSPVTKLVYMTPNQMDTTFITTTIRQPTNYSIVGGNIRLGPTPDTSYSVVIGYYQKIPALSNSNTTNWLLSSAPGLYLAASLFQACLFLEDDDNAVKWGRLFAGRIKAFRRQDIKGRFSGDQLRIMTDTGNP